MADDNKLVGMFAVIVCQPPGFGIEDAVGPQLVFFLEVEDSIVRGLAE